MVALISLTSRTYAVLAIHTNRALNGSRSNTTMVNIAPTHAGVNVLLGGAMMSCMLIMVVCVCYLCHWRFQKTEAQYEQQHSWVQMGESDATVHIFTLDQQCYENSNSVQLEEETTERPPPDYDDVIAMDKRIREGHDPDLPSYETALKLSSRGYV
ncbi:Hypothetical protein NTJ_02846 [Nesidiocoris tenuis]|uniref:Protein tweety homolog n=1 Tax=Nesidiocoris tenuis TaxID=355587 RepID=A0ABN7ADH2_9HEMI|nr:Hypothetical protein NTJ_02846 [Nesidiocoris tenuis]